MVVCDQHPHGQIVDARSVDSELTAA
jgi:hypothetical protein